MHICSGGFDGSCSSIGISGTVLHANCKNVGGTLEATSIDTGKFIFLIILL